MPIEIPVQPEKPTVIPPAEPPTPIHPTPMPDVKPNTEPSPAPVKSKAISTAILLKLKIL